jgi:hypothetical protein
VLGADVAEGLEGGDYSAGTLIDAMAWDELASLHGHWEPDEYAKMLLKLADVYGAEIAVERNNHGHAVLVTLKAAKCTRTADGHDDKPGWLTTAQTKPQSIDLLATALRDNHATVRSAAALDEMQIYRIGKDGDTSAPPSYHDDYVMSWAIALMVAKRPSSLAKSTQIENLWKRR